MSSLSAAEAKGQATAAPRPSLRSSARGMAKQACSKDPHQGFQGLGRFRVSGILGFLRASVVHVYMYVGTMCM